ncbi:hypothetical protein [Streptomyces sp. BE133]|uniref:hypothetical protein n=1 Tax=Streptomyces sp. BE133 TaxID=3002523 RepID=UPI002E78684E|nr:hypothetical protein [Streptomyces sp. BE133]MEE1810136.1 hypothetical protein [Streptomyces sp. BE133]
MSGATTLPTASGPYLDKGPLPADFHAHEELLSDREREKIESVREFLRTQAAPIVDGDWARAEFPFGRFVAAAEALYSYKGTREIQTLIVGRAVTGGPSAFVR